MGKLVRGKNGRFVKGKSGNPLGRPKGSKNVITLQKLLVEEAFRANNAEGIGLVLEKILAQALEGDKNSQKLVWDSAVSRQDVKEDKSAGVKQQITVHTLNVGQDKPKPIIEGEFNVEEEIS